MSLEVSVKRRRVCELSRIGQEKATPLAPPSARLSEGRTCSCDEPPEKSRRDFEIVNCAKRFHSKTSSRRKGLSWRPVQCGRDNDAGLGTRPVRSAKQLSNSGVCIDLTPRS